MKLVCSCGATYYRARNPAVKTSAVLARVRENIQVEVLERLDDGSAPIQVPVREGSGVIAWLKLRWINLAAMDLKALTVKHPALCFSPLPILCATCLAIGFLPLFQALSVADL